MGKPRDLWDFIEKPLRLLSPDEIYEQASEELLCNLEETRYVERKPANFSGNSLGQYVCMWANTSPDGGIIALGVTNDGKIEGCLKLSEEQVNEREKVGFNFCPEAKVKTKHVPVKNRDGGDDFVVLYRVAYHRDKVVTDHKGKAYVRRGDSKTELSPEEVRELQCDKGEVSFEEQPARLTYPDDFDQKAITTFVEAVRARREMARALSPTEVMELRHLGSINNDSFMPNHACALLFARDPLRLVPGCKIHFQRFEGEHERTGQRYNAVKDMILEGNIPSLLQQVESTLESQLRTFSPLDRKGKFFPVPEYPKVAWYEAIVNACVHRSYGNGMKNMPIFVKMFDDRLVIESPGPFPPFVTPENIYQMHKPRNPHLMDALFYLQLVLCSHEGARRIRDTMAEMKLPAPEFRQDDISHAIVRVTLRNNIKQRRAWIDQDVSRIVSEAIAADLSEEEKRVLNFAAEHGSINISDTIRLLSIHRRSATKVLYVLVTKRILQYIRFKEMKGELRDPKAFFRLRSNDPLPEGSFEQSELPEIIR